jgi:hypothetical protein
LLPLPYPKASDLNSPAQCRRRLAPRQEPDIRVWQPAVFPKTSPFDAGVISIGKQDHLSGEVIERQFLATSRRSERCGSTSAYPSASDIQNRMSALPLRMSASLPKADLPGRGSECPRMTQLRHSFSSQFALPPICTSPGWATTRLSGARLRRSGRWSEHECCRKVTLPVTARSCLLDGP